MKKFFLESFTLIELLVVIVILGILVGFAIPKFGVFVERGRQQEGINFLSHVHSSQLRFFYSSEPSAWPIDISELDIEINPLKYFDETGLFLDDNNGSAQLPRREGSTWSYTLQIDRNASFNYSFGTGPGGLPK